jgi:hypothetical protein
LLRKIIAIAALMKWSVQGGAGVSWILGTVAARDCANGYAMGLDELA